MHNISRALRNNPHKLATIGWVPEGRRNMYCSVSDNTISWLDGSQDDQHIVNHVGTHHVLTRDGVFVNKKYIPLDHFPRPVTLSVNDTQLCFRHENTVVVENITTRRSLTYLLPPLPWRMNTGQYLQFRSQTHNTYYVPGEGECMTDSNKRFVGRTDTSYIFVDRIGNDTNILYTTDKGTANTLSEQNRVCPLQPVLELGVRMDKGFVHGNILVLLDNVQHPGYNRNHYFYSIFNDNIRWLWTAVFEKVSVVDGKLRACQDTGEYVEIFFT